MKYEIKYLIKRVTGDCCFPFSYYGNRYALKIYNIDDCELINDTFEIEINLLSVLFSGRYCINVSYCKNKYYGLSEKHFRKYKNRYPYECEELIEKKYVKNCKRSNYRKYNKIKFLIIKLIRNNWK